MDERGQYTRDEILTQPAAWTAALGVLDAQRQDLARLAPRGYAQVIFTGCGSTYYAALAAAAILQDLSGIAARGMPASELWTYPGSSYAPGRTLLIALSRSGETTETLEACAEFRRAARGDLLTLSCYADRPLAGMGQWNVVLPSGQERSIAQTRAFTTLYLATVWLAAVWAGKDELTHQMARLEERGARLLVRCAALASDLGGDESLDRFYWLGSGPRYGLACEISLKMKEMSLSHSEPFHFMEFRHGPKSMLMPSALVVGLRSSAQAAHEAAVLQDAAGLGARVLAIAEDPKADVPLESGLDEAIRNVLYLPAGQLIAFERSLARGLNPDLPHNLDAVVKLT
jgi:glucosamine--fructose-6-phosphate aminotransferase (isomerizing)